MRTISSESTKNPFTRQRVLLKRTRRGDSPCVIDTALTREASILDAKRRIDNPRVIVNVLTCQRALSYRSKRQGDSPRVIDKDQVHGSTTTVQKRDLYETSMILLKTYTSLSKTYLKLSSSINDKSLFDKVRSLEHQSQRQTTNENLSNDYSSGCDNTKIYECENICTTYEKLLRNFTKMLVTVDEFPLFINRLYITNISSNSYTLCILSNVVETYSNFSERNQINNCYNQQKSTNVKLAYFNSTTYPYKSIEKNITKIFRQARSKSRNMRKVVTYLKMRER